MAIKVLLADDSITIQKVISIIFSGAEYSLTVVSNGTAAVEKARELIPDVLLIDVNMPGLDGYQTSEAIRGIPALSSKPILLLTGTFEPFDEERAKLTGADDFIDKPFESQLIISKVNDLHAAALAKAAALAPVDDHAPETFDIAPDASAEAALIATDDIWGAFTSLPDTEESPATFTEIATDAGIFPDFGFEETEAATPVAETTVTAAPDQTTETSTVPQWGNFEIDPFETAPASETTDDLTPDSAFDETAFNFSYREITSPPPSEPEPAMQSVEPVTPAAIPTLTEEQLKAAISAVSKDVIERIVWEVVPDLAENIINEAIRRIREGK